MDLELFFDSGEHVEADRLIIQIFPFVRLLFACFGLLALRHLHLSLLTILLFLTIFIFLFLIFLLSLLLSLTLALGLLLVPLFLSLASDEEMVNELYNLSLVPSSLQELIGGLLS